MEYRILKYFLVVAEFENITKAAQQLHVSQPSLSRQLMQLENTLGVQLFIRSKHKVILSEEGKLFKRRAQELVALYEKTTKELQVKEMIEGEISVGCAETKNMLFLSKAIASFQVAYPSVTFQINTYIADDTKDKIDSGILDFGMLIEPCDISKYHYMQMPIKEKWCALVPKDHPLSKLEVIQPKDLQHTSLILTKRQSVQNELENWFGHYFKDFHIVATTNLSYTNRSMMVLQGVGIALVHEFDVPSDNLCLIPLYPTVENGSVFVWKKEENVSRLKQAFITHLKNAKIA